ncbi:MAG: YmdB family metallophosphoesterase [Treponema sp.]|nr:YmdB family metallophosphoesterase [Treponema sp.]
MAVIRVIMIGDVVGDPGLEALEKRLPALRAEYAPLLVTVNGENAAAGFGLDAASLDRIFAAGADVVTSGNHVWEKREFWPVLESGKPVIRPANYPPAGRESSGEPGSSGEPEKAALPDIPGKGWLLLEKPVPKTGSPGKDMPGGEKDDEGERVSFLVINLQGRKRMTAIDCPFRCFDRIAAENHSAKPLVMVDFHAESTEEKEALGYYLDGRAGVVAGTHTHVQTADERILPGGTAYITDLGMTGAANGVIGMDAGICIDRANTQIAYRMECARPASEEDLAVQGIVAELDSGTGRALAIRRINV